MIILGCPFVILGKTIDNNSLSDEDSELISILRERRSRSTASEKKKISLKDLSLLSWAGDGVVGPDRFFRTAPSAGALYPCELYMLSLNTELEQGLYHYRPSIHNLEVLKVTDINLD
ncbi:hypothetical protein [Bacillus thuringiensis]|uniref:hypothetical protein n=1 Tax=Bacillus thuringiensis TaxID=1428 RepID=UPI001EDEBDB2|nr:hypothetical protein [Bacillus thuringiensis]MCG3426529.1 hypothetical protein [Bacillus thuringiensis]